MKIKLLFVSCLGAAASALAADSAPNISAANILAHVKTLSSDEFEGRAPGSPGEEKTVAYLVAEFKRLGLAPGNPDGTYIQNVPLVGISSTPTLSFVHDGVTIPMENINEFVGPSSRLTPHVAAKDSDVVFVIMAARFPACAPTGPPISRRRPAAMRRASSMRCISSPPAPPRSAPSRARC
jgi:hypothetical protein